MSSITMSPSVVVASSARRASRTIDWKTFASLGLATTLAASIANALVFLLGDAIIGYDPAFVELGSALGIAIFTGVLALGAVLVYAALLRTTDHPARNFTIVSAVVFVATLVPDFTFIPGEPGVTRGEIAVLVIMHAVAAALIVRMLTTFSRA